MWAALSRQSKWIGILATVGFITRAIGGLILFWISYLGLPLGSRLQLGNGLWFFALDGSQYMIFANAAAASGLHGIVFITRTMGSFFYVQVLAAFVLLFGGAACTALLLNLFCYLASCLAIVWWGRETANEKLAAIAVGAVALSPSGILWALQPLKDSLFLFLVIAFAALAMKWQMTWRPAVERRAVPLIVTAVLMWIVLFGIAGIRWYFAFVTWFACAIFLLLVVFAAARPVLAFLSAVVMTALLSQAVLIGSGDFLSPTIRRVLSWRAPSAMPDLAPTLITQVEESREGFDRAVGATQIRPEHASAPAGQARVKAGGPPRSVAGGTATPARKEADRKVTALTPTRESRLQRLVAGAAAVLLPRAIAQRLGVIEVGGGRGFWLFAEIDTIAFDLILAVAVIYTLGSIRRSFRSPVFWHVALMTVLTAVPLIYAVSNFGTLFRHRSMIYVGLVLIPLAVASSSEDGRRWKRDIAA